MGSRTDQESFFKEVSRPDIQYYAVIVVTFTKYNNYIHRTSEAGTPTTATVVTGSATPITAIGGGVKTPVTVIYHIPQANAISLISMKLHHVCNQSEYSIITSI